MLIHDSEMPGLRVVSLLHAAVICQVVNIELENCSHLAMLTA